MAVLVLIPHDLSWPRRGFRLAQSSSDAYGTVLWPPIGLLERRGLCGVLIMTPSHPRSMYLGDLYVYPCADACGEAVMRRGNKHKWATAQRNYNTTMQSGLI
jgi:hypothetical protein